MRFLDLSLRFLVSFAAGSFIVQVILKDSLTYSLVMVPVILGLLITALCIPTPFDNREHQS